MTPLLKDVTVEWERENIWTTTYRVEGDRSPTKLSIKCCGHLEKGGPCRVRSKRKSFIEVLKLSKASVYSEFGWANSKGVRDWYTGKRELGKQIQTPNMQERRRKRHRDHSGWLEHWMGKGKYGEQRPEVDCARSSVPVQGLQTWSGSNRPLTSR